MSLPRLPARVFYGVILAGVLLGVAAFTVGGWLSLEHEPESGGEPVGRLWADLGRWLVIPVCAMMGATFGGLAGFAVAAVWDRRASS
jgi:hypothetical protein